MAVSFWHRLKSFIKSRIHVIEYDDSIANLNTLNANVIGFWSQGDKHIKIVKDYKNWADKLRQRILDCINKFIPDKSFLLFIMLEPYSIKYRKFKSGVGWYCTDWGLIIVSYCSLLTSDEFPYLEHEIAHATGILRSDHANLKELIHKGLLKR